MLIYAAQLGNDTLPDTQPELEDWTDERLQALHHVLMEVSRSGCKDLMFPFNMICYDISNLLAYNPVSAMMCLTLQADIFHSYISRKGR